MRTRHAAKATFVAFNAVRATFVALDARRQGEEVRS
jgi:hypothetical protein